MKQRFKNFFSGFVVAGLINILLGLFYWIIKAGIPYQDPTLEMQINYAANMRVGDILIVIGAILFIIGILGKIVLYFFRNKAVS
jgi:hypothetical protein